MSETSDVTTPLIEALNAIPGVVARRQHAGRVRIRGGWMHLGAEGWPDILVIVHGRAILLETKPRKGGRMEASQIEMHKKLAANGIPVRVCRGVAEGISIVRDILIGTRAAS